MFDMPPSALVYLLIVPCFGLVLLGWMLYGLSQTSFRPYGLGLLLAFVAFVLTNVATAFLGEVLTQVFGLSTQPPPDAPETWERPFNDGLEFALGAFYIAANIASCIWSLRWPLRGSSAPNQALRLTTEADARKL